MSHDKGYSRRGRPDRRRDGGKLRAPLLGEKGREVVENIDANSPVIRNFKQYAAELDFKHDKHERIVKHSRDITIESKRIIFLLHTLDRESKVASVLSEAESRFAQLAATHFKLIAQELEGEDPYQFLRAYTAGLQEFIEAVTFYHYVKSSSLPGWDIIQKELTYDFTGPQSSSSSGEQLTDDQKASSMAEKDVHNKKEEARIVQTLLPPLEYILGVADLTGELMRKCINNLGLGNIDSCYQTCAFVKKIYKGFLLISSPNVKELNRKVYTLRQSLSKMENACYTIHVRGSEIPKHMLADVLRGGQDDYLDVDEGFY